MKKIIFVVIILAVLTFRLQAQNDTSGTIEVVGIAIMEILPDYSVVSFELSEYDSEAKQITTIVEQERELLRILRELGIDERDLRFNNFGKNKVYRRKTTEVYNSKWYYLKIFDLKKLIPFNTQVNKLNLTSFSLNELNHTKIENFKKELYTNSIINAKEKAEIILKVLNKKVGDPIEIKEFYSSNMVDPIKFENSTKYQQIGKGGFAEEPELTVGEIRLAYKLNVKFNIN